MPLISPGNSGGGLVDDDEPLIGIAHGTFERGQMLNLFVHPQCIHAFLAKRGLLPKDRTSAYRRHPKKERQASGDYAPPR